MAITKIVDDMRTTTVLDAAKVTTGTMDAARIGSGTMDAARIGSGTLANARISQSSVTQHSPPADLTPAQNDIAILALHQAVQSNQTAHGLANSWVEVFEDSTYIDNLSDVLRTGTPEYVSSIGTETGAFDHTAVSETYSWFGTTPYNSGFAAANYVNNLYDTTPPDVTMFWNSPSTGYATGFQVDYLTNLVNISTIDVSKCNYYGCARQFRLKYSTNGSSWTILNLTNATTSAISGTVLDSITFVDRANGVADFNDTRAPGVQFGGGKLTGFTAFTARYLRFELGTWQSLENASVGFSNLIPYYDAVSANATGSFTSTVVVPQDKVNKSKVGLVVLYKENAGGVDSTVLNTNLVAKVRANTGQAYQSVTLVKKGTFSSGVRIAIAEAVDVTAGQALSYEISFAGQVLSSLETQIHGVALTY